MTFSARLLSEDTWPDFTRLVEENNGVWGGCWCIGFHPEGFVGARSPDDNRERKLGHVRNGTVHQMLVYDGDRCVGWSQFGPPAEVASIKNARAYAAESKRLPDWRMGCIFTGAGHRGQGVAREAVSAALGRSGRQVAAWSRRTRSRPRTDPSSAAHICIPVRNPCTRSSGSPVIVGSRSGDGSCDSSSRGSRCRNVGRPAQPRRSGHLELRGWRCMVDGSFGNRDGAAAETRDLRGHGSTPDRAFGSCVTRSGW